MVENVLSDEKYQVAVRLFCTKCQCGYSSSNSGQSEHLTAYCYLLLNHGASVNAVNNDGVTPLHDAASRGHVDILQVLLNHAASVNAVNNDGVTPLHYDAWQGHVDILQLLLNHGASVNAVNKAGDTPLHDTALAGHVDILQLLLNHGASVNAVNKEVIHHYTKLHLGVMLISYNCCLAMVPV